MSTRACAPGVDASDVVTVYESVGRDLMDGCARVRALHDVIDLGGGWLICDECSRGGVRVLWPCTTLQLLDNMPAP